MKAVIAICLGELIIEKFGKDKWKDALEGAGLDRNTVFLATEDVDDNACLEVVGSVCKVLNITLEQAADAFGEYWVNTYAPKIYKGYYRFFGKTAKDFILAMDKVHVMATKDIQNALPPRFEYEWTDDKTLIMKYKSHRHLIAFLIGLIRGIGKYYDENLEVTKIDETHVKIVFLDK